MRYYIIDIVKMKLYSYNDLNELIDLFKTKMGTTIPLVEPLENLIFHPKTFDTAEKLALLKETIGGFIGESPAKDEIKINARTMNQFFCLYAALWSRPNVLANESMADFIRQMALWFPQCFPKDTDRKRFGRFTKALSAEQSNWKDRNGLKKVTEWKKFIKEKNRQNKKTGHFERLAMEIYLAVNQLVKGW